eukprot:m.75577 g.75577  ORF g.75577 m.75577 type:complete len:69 (-) comp8486_c0_seq10:830-1036(-)
MEGFNCKSKYKLIKIRSDAFLIFHLFKDATFFFHLIHQRILILFSELKSRCWLGKVNIYPIFSFVNAL